MNFKQAIGKTIERIEIIESEQRVTEYDSSPLPQAVRESRVKTLRITFTDGTDDEFSLRCD
jgi:hypothetical protein